MAFVYETKLGPPDWGKRKGTGTVILHTTESTSINMAGARVIADLQTKGTLKGSYNKIIAVDGVLTTVPDTLISGGVNPTSPYWKPAAWLYNILPAYKVNDPNSYALELSFMGRRDKWDANGWNPVMIDAAARIILAEEKRIGAEVIVINHRDFQTNRTDAGSIATDLVMKRYQELTSGVEDDQLTIVEIKPFSAPRNATINAGTVGLRGFNPKTGAIEKVYDWPNTSGFLADAYVVITQEPQKAPQGTFIRASNGIYAGLVLEPKYITLGPEPSVCDVEVAEATVALQNQIASLNEQMAPLKEDSQLLGRLRRTIKEVLG